MMSLKLSIMNLTQSVKFSWLNFCIKGPRNRTFEACGFIILKCCQRCLNLEYANLWRKKNILLFYKHVAGADPGEVKWVNFYPPFSELPFFFFFFSYPSNIEIIFDFSDIITKIHPPFQNPGSALASQRIKIVLKLL